MLTYIKGKMHKIYGKNIKKSQKEAQCQGYIGIKGWKNEK